MTLPRTLIAIGLCTFQRPQVLATLASLEAQDWPAGTHGAIFVIDNDEQPSAAPAILAFCKTSRVPVQYLHKPARNISLARNAVLEAARVGGAEYLAFLDDDETAEPDWIAQLWTHMLTGKVDVVLGPVTAIYAATAPRWMRQGRVHDTNPSIEADGSIRSGYTCNVMLKLSSPAIVGQGFDLARGQSGGEDTAYFTAIHRAGGLIVFASDARLTEPVPKNRATLWWLLRRRFRMGQTHASLISVDAGIMRRARLTLVASAKVGACAGLALLNVLKPVARNHAVLRCALHLGAAAALLGRSSLTLYGSALQDGDVTSRRSL